MRPALVTLLPMLAAAGLVLVGGERLARTEVETRVAADRNRLVDFSEAFEAELERLDALYRSHLARLASDFGNKPDNAVEEEARGYEGIRAMTYFTIGKKRGDLALLPVGADDRLPEIVREGQDRPLNQNNAVVLPQGLLDADWEREENRHGWLEAPHPAHAIYWIRPDLVRLVVFVLHQSHLETIVANHLEEWADPLLAPLRENDEQIALFRPNGENLFQTIGADRGPAALVLPHRSNFGDWQIEAWDRVTVSTHHDTATLVTAGTLAAVLALGGLLLCIQQRRALRLAEERVSFVNRVSHELGTPLTNIALNLDLAKDALETRRGETQRRLAIVTEEIERLARLVANVLTFSRRERHTLQIDPQPCIPDEVVATTIASFRPALERRGIAIEQQYAATERVRLDPDALGQILGNLISNVEKYGAAGGWLGITSTLADETLTIEVSDHGPGIPAKSREKIFQPFERVHQAVTEGSSGTGLGLTIARELAHRMGGSLTLCEAERGTTFALRLPAPPVLAVVSDHSCRDENSAA